MRYVQTSSGSFYRHIRDEFESIRWDETNKTSVRKLPDAKRIEFGISRLQMVTPPAYDSASQTRGEGDAVLVGAVWTQNWIVTDLADEALALAQSVAAVNAEKDAKLKGIEILGVMCSATKEDQNGMLAIGFDKLTNTMAGTKMGSTVMKFENGSELVVTDENFNAVDALWRPFRKSFFTP